MGKQVDLLQGTLDLLILKAVSLGELHGYGILLRIQAISGERLLVQQGSLYPALYRLEAAGSLQTQWGPSENNRRAKFYSLTPEGQRQLETETTRWVEMSRLMAAVLRATAVPEAAR